MAFVVARAQPPTAETLPRLSGTVIGGGSRVAIFTDPDGGNMQVAKAGEAVGAFIVSAVNPGEARLVGQGGEYAIQPSPPLGARSLQAAPVPVVPLIDPAYREAVTENDQ